MGFLKKIFHKDNDIIDTEDFDPSTGMIKKKETVETENLKDQIEMDDYISSLKLEELYELKDKLQTRIDYLLDNLGLKSKKEDVVNLDVEKKTNDYYTEKVERLRKEAFEEQKKKEERYESKDRFDEDYKKVLGNITKIAVEEPNFNKSSFDEKSKEIEQEYINISVDDYDKKAQINDKELKDLVLEEIESIFGKENVIFRIKDDFRIDQLRGKKVHCIGIRAKGAFDDLSFNDEKQGKWFIGNIKNLNNLKDFKMLESSPVLKVLVSDKKDYSILITYKSTSMLISKEGFDFNF